MANNCLVTKLKSVVLDNTLGKFDCIKIKVHATGSEDTNDYEPHWLWVKDAKGIYQNPDMIEFPEGKGFSRRGSVQDGDYTIFIKNKYKGLVEIEMGTCLEVDPKDMKYCENVCKIDYLRLINNPYIETLDINDLPIEQLYYISFDAAKCVGSLDGVNLNSDLISFSIANSNISFNSLDFLKNCSKLVSLVCSSCKNASGNLEDLSNFTTLERIAVWSSNVGNGSIEAFKRCTKLISLNIAKTVNVTGEINNLCQGMFDNGRKSGTFSLCCSPDVTLDGNLVGNDYWVDITFTESGFTSVIRGKV